MTAEGVTDGPEKGPETGAGAVLFGLARAGVTRILVVGGAERCAIDAALADRPAREAPDAVRVPDAATAVAMAHGCYLVTGRPQAVLVRGDAGLAAAVAGLVAAASDDVPVIVLWARDPCPDGSGMCAGGDMLQDASAMIAEVTKHRAELRHPDEGAALAARAVMIARTAPCAPVCLSLPGDALAAAVSVVVSVAVPEAAGLPAPAAPALPAAPEAEGIAALAMWLTAARAPLILCRRGDPEGRVGAALAALADRHAVAVVEPVASRTVMANDHPMFLGRDPGPAIAAADLIVVLDSALPGEVARLLPRPGQGGGTVRIVHIGPDPVFARRRTPPCRSDLAITAGAAQALEALIAALPAPGAEVAARRARRVGASAAPRAATDAALRAGAGPIPAEVLARGLSRVLGARGVMVADRSGLPGALRCAGPNRLFATPDGGGPGWALPAALGVQMADLSRPVVACTDAAGYAAANPVVCHRIAGAAGLPVLIVVASDGAGDAPDCAAVARACGAHGARVADAAALPGALARAVAIIRDERRQVLLDVCVAAAGSG